MNFPGALIFQQQWDDGGDGADGIHADLRLRVYRAVFGDDGFQTAHPVEAQQVMFCDGAEDI